MEIFPTYGHVLCEMLDIPAVQSCIAYEKETLPIYKIIKHSNAADDFRFNVGDMIIVNSIPTKLNLGSTIYYIIKIENIAGKIAT